MSERKDTNNSKEPR